MSFQQFHIGTLKIGEFVEGIHLKRGVIEMFQSNETKILLEGSTQGIVLVNNLRVAVTSPTADMILKAIPGDWDTKLRDHLVNVVIPKIIAANTRITPCLEKETVDEQIVCLFDTVASNPLDTERAAFWHGLAASLAHEIILFVLGQPLDINDIFLAIVSVFKKLFSKKAAA